ncbi:MAG: ABC-2 transporter permease [Oscillospiraceae bacterium]|nr:ABC-2 transporter permease [Oscillospiraceae bacterium]
MGAIFKREMKAFFTSPIAYIFIAIFWFIAGIYFVFLNLGSATTDMSYVFSGVFIFVLILIPLLTMRLFADEKKLKTDQCLLTAPVSLSGIVFGKFFSALCVFLCAMVIYIPFVIVLRVLAGSLAMAQIVGNFTGLLLVGASFISIGIFISSLTEMQIISAIVSIIVNFVLYMIDVFASSVTWEPLKKAMVAIGFYNRYVEFTQGIFNITSVIFFISVIFIFSVLTVRVLEKRRWS